MHMSDVMTLFDYNYWATGQIMDQAARLTPEQFVTMKDTHSTCLRDTLVHMLGAERLWRTRWQQGVSSTMLYPEDIPTVEALRVAWADEEHALRAYLATLSDDSLARPTRFERRGAMVSYTLWHMMMQLFNHGTHHRSEAAALLAAYGQSPGDLDFFLFVQPHD